MSELQAFDPDNADNTIEEFKIDYKGYEVTDSSLKTELNSSENQAQRDEIQKKMASNDQKVAATVASKTKLPINEVTSLLKEAVEIFDLGWNAAAGTAPFANITDTIIDNYGASDKWKNGYPVTAEACSKFANQMIPKAMELYNNNSDQATRDAISKLTSQVENLAKIIKDANSTPEEKAAAYKASRTIWQQIWDAVSYPGRKLGEWIKNNPGEFVKSIIKIVLFVLAYPELKTIWYFIKNLIDGNAPGSGCYYVQGKNKTLLQNCGSYYDNNSQYCSCPALTYNLWLADPTKWDTTTMKTKCEATAASSADVWNYPMCSYASVGATGTAAQCTGLSPGPAPCDKTASTYYYEYNNFNLFDLIAKFFEDAGNILNGSNPIEGLIMNVLKWGGIILAIGFGIWIIILLVKAFKDNGEGGSKKEGGKPVNITIEPGGNNTAAISSRSVK